MAAKSAPPNRSEEAKYAEGGLIAPSSATMARIITPRSSSVAVIPADGLKQ